MGVPALTNSSLARSRCQVDGWIRGQSSSVVRVQCIPGCSLQAAACTGIFAGHLSIQEGAPCAASAVLDLPTRSKSRGTGAWATMSANAPPFSMGMC